MLSVYSVFFGILFDGFNGIAAIDHDMHFEPQKKQKTDK